MWKRRLLFSIIFFVGTLMAAFGWMAEYRHWALHIKWLALAGHVLQVIGVYGHLVTPDDTMDNDETGEAEDDFFKFEDKDLK